MDLSSGIRIRREACGLTQIQLAELAGIDPQMVARYEAGEAQPNLPVAAVIAQVLQVTISGLAKAGATTLDLSGAWWLCLQSAEGTEVADPRLMVADHRGERMTIAADGDRNGDPGWRGALRLWDDSVLLGWYLTGGAAPRRGTMYFELGPEAAHMTGRWVGPSDGGPPVSGWGAMARDGHTTAALVSRLRDGAPARR
jgi:transcriptional regulator with XRE-family HTH domain